MNATLDFLERQLKDGSQAYVVSPLIEESEAVDLKMLRKFLKNLKKDMRHVIKSACFMVE